MRADEVAVVRMMTPRPTDMKEWQVVAVQRREFMQDKEDVLLETDDRGHATSFAESEAKRRDADLIIEGEKVAGVQHVDDWKGNEWGFL